MALLNFDASQVAPDAGQLDPIPADWYVAQVTNSELKPTKNGSGTILNLTFKVLEGPFVNRVIFSGFNIRNANPTAQEIAFKQLSAVAHAVGVLQVADSTQLHGIPLRIRVKVKAAEGDYAARNEITTYKHISEPVPASGLTGGAQVGGSQALPAFMQPKPLTPAPAPQAMPAFMLAAPAAQAAPAPAQNFAPVQQPWMQPATTGQIAPAQQAPAQQAPQQAPAQPAWATAPLPEVQAAAPVVEQAPASPPVEAAAVAAVQNEVPPWMQQIAQ